MKRLRASYEYWGDTIKLMFRSGRNKRASVSFDETNLDLQINDVTVLRTDADGAAVTGTLAVSGITTTSGNLVAENISLQSGVVDKVASTTLTATEIVGTAAGDVGHASGATLVAAPGAGYALEFVSAVLIYDYDTAAYTGGGDDNVIQNGSTATALSAAIAGADLLEAAGDKIVQVNALAATDQALVENMPLSLKGTALTQPGTAAGVLRCHVAYRVHTTGL